MGCSKVKRLWPASEEGSRWRGYILAEFALVWVANSYVGLSNRLRLDIKVEI